MTKPFEATWAARLTPPVPAALATIGLYGPHAERIIALAFRSMAGRPISFIDHQPRYGLWSLLGSDLPPEHVVVLRRDGTEFEINCHGGLQISSAMLHMLEQQGCRLCSDMDVPSRPFRSIESQAERALIQSSTLKVAVVLLDQVQGALTRELNVLLAAVEARDAATARHLSQQLVSRADFGQRLLAPWRLALAGPPNVGKSSLINGLYGATRVLVHHEPGTTRDAIDATIVVSSWPIVITDTAGVRETKELIEAQGIAATWQRWRESDIGLLVVDATVGWTETHRQLLEVRSQTTMLVLNKCDLMTKADNARELERSLRQQMTAREKVPIVRTSATSAAGTADLLETLGEYFDAQLPPARAGVPFLAEHTQRLQRILQLIIETRLQEAESQLRDWLAARSTASVSASSTPNP